MDPTLQNDAIRFLGGHSLLGRPGIVAVSGGPDSVALAHLLASASIAFTIAHLNHQLRGTDSDADETFVQTLGDKLHLPCRTTRIDTAARAAAAKDNLEATARATRYDWLAQVAREENASWVAVGHTADDQAETVLFRLLRGSGLHGLAGMRERRPLAPGVDLIRPLLRVRRSELLAYLKEGGHDYCLDASNLDPRFTRNRIRGELMPFLEANYQHELVDVLNRLAQQAREVDELLTAAAQKLLTEVELPRAGELVILSADRLAAAPRHLQREVARLVWTREAWPQGAMTFEHWDRFAVLVAGEDAPSDFPDGVTVRRVGRVVQLGRSVAGPRR
jgi:tRNA(Ile)-lysidine synthase